LKPNAQRSVSIEVASLREPNWVLPATHIPSDSERMKKVASDVIQGETNVIKASLKLRSFVEKKVRYNAGIGVIRDANEVLETAEGVCRDHAILFVTLLRAAGIPSRIVGGVVNWGTGFYYHAWVEVFDGQDWIGLDSTSDLDFITPAHIKFGQGNVDQAFTFNFPSAAKAELVSTKRREIDRSGQLEAQPRS
jgi:transglutaminase-like putative cysteine protease